MSKSPNISIGEDRWIFWIDLNHSETPFNIDDYLKPTQSFWKHLETECFSACCGIDAFALWPDDIKNASTQLKDLNVIQELIKLRLLISNRPENSLISFFLNNMFHKNVFLQLLDHVISCL